MEHTNKLSKKDTIKLIIIAASAVIVLCAFLVFASKLENGADIIPLSKVPLFNIAKTMLISMIPIIELRGSIPLARNMYHMSYAASFLFAYIGNCIVIIPVTLLTRTVFDWLKKHIPFLRRIVEKLENRLLKKSVKALKYAELGLLLFVAIPVPGTGAWTGSMISGLIGLRLKTAAPIIAVGVLIAGIIVGVVALTAKHAVGIFA